jgi:phytoene dehydrogenase-like protein
MNRHVAIIGAGMGGLTAALRLARAGFAVTVVEARSGPGGLASGFEQEGLTFDGGPYVLLDRPGLEWAFEQLGLSLTDLVSLHLLQDVYQVQSPTDTVRFHFSLDQTIDGLESTWSGSGRRYRRFVESVWHTYRRLQPLQRISRPGLWDLVRTGAIIDAPFLVRPLSSVLRATKLPQPVQDALAIWTHVAGQRVEAAPSPLAFVCGLIHAAGAYYPVGGVGVIPRVLARAVEQAGVTFRFGTRVQKIRCESGRAVGVEMEGDYLPADAVISNHSGIGTYLDLVNNVPPPEQDRLRRLPLQSPGVCAYLAIKGSVRPPYLRFFLPGNGQLCRLLIRPAVVDPACAREGWQPARLLAPMAHADAEAGGETGQRAYLERILGEEWWREGIDEYRIVTTRIPQEWGRNYYLYRDSMNPVMTAAFMREGRLAHRSPHVRGLYLAGSSTHPGQWVSFCAVSGVLAADLLRTDFS